MNLEEKQIAADRKDIMVKTDGGMVKPRKSITKVVNNESKSMIGFKEYKEIYEGQEAELDRQIEEAVVKINKDKHGNVLSGRTVPDGSPEAVAHKNARSHHGTASDTMMKKLQQKAVADKLKESENVPNYFMFSSKGNEEVHKIVTGKHDYHTAMSKLKSLSKKKGYEEANDTAVRDAVHSHLKESELEENSPFDWKNKKSEIDWKSDDKTPAQSKEGGTVYKAREGSRNAETGGAAAKKSVGRPAGEYGGYKIDKATRDTKEYKDALSAKVRAAKADGFAARDEFKKGMDAAIKKRQLEIAGIKQ